MQQPRITFLGHASFLLQSKDFNLLIDPWLSSNGAYFNSWYQFPCNHHLSDWILSLIKMDTRPTYVYISHNDKDHIDSNFISSLPAGVNYFIPKFQSISMLESLIKHQKINRDNVTVFEDEETFNLFDYELTFFIQDSGRESDSAIMIKGKGISFFNSNDCKLHDRLHYITKKFGDIDILAMQFSGASWYPVSYKHFLGDKKYESISKKKRILKFRALTNVIKYCGIKNYIPSAGPPCFLDPYLFETNFEKENIFPDTDRIVDHLRKQKDLNVIEMLPGQYFQWPSLTVKRDHNQPKPEISFEVLKKSKEDYLRKYQASRAVDFLERESKEIKFDVVLQCVREELEEKINRFTLQDKVERNLYVRIENKDCEEMFLKVNFRRGTIESLNKIDEENYYCVSFRAVDLYHYYFSDENLDFHDLLLSCRQKMSRSPDTYDYLIDAFLCLDAEDFKEFEKSFYQRENNECERIVVHGNSKSYEINRYCPHEYADLKYSEIDENDILVCPRHCWEFDLKNKGVCSKIERYSIHSHEVRNKV